MRYLTNELIKEIKQVEMNSAELILNAQNESKENIRQAEQKAEQILKETINSEIQKGKKLVEEAEVQFKNESIEKMTYNRTVCDELKQNARSKLDQAVRFVMERIVSIDGDS